MSFELISAPAIIIAWIIPRLPLIDAICNGVRKFFDLASIFAPYSTNNSIKSTWPSFAARWSGVHPSLFC
jgi:hypothetical protein